MSADSTPSGVAAPGRRLLLVGRCDAEHTLRARVDIELLRARTGTDAIGELALAQDENAPVDAVLIGHDAVHEAERAGFESALRSTDVHVRIIDVAHRDAASVLEALREPSSTSSGASIPPHKPAPVATAPLDTDAQGISCLDAILAGGDPVAPFITQAQATTGDTTLRFDRAAPEHSTARFAPVSRRGTSFGYLIADNASVEALARLSAELAGWMALQEQQRQLRSAAFTDQLTGAWNRRYFDYFMPRALELARRRRNDVTLMVYDIDDFKTYNDRYGHAAGDDILRETVRLLISVIRPTDRVCRIGGDEFAVIFDDPTGPREGAGHHPTSIAGITARFQRQICEHRFPKLAEDAPGTLTISGGMATFPWDGGTAEELLQRADQLALQSKQQGKNLITFGPGAQRVCGVPGPHGESPTTGR